MRFHKETSKIEHLTRIFKHTPDIGQLSFNIWPGTECIKRPRGSYRIALHKLERLSLYACNDDGPTYDDLLSFLFDDDTLRNVRYLALSRPITFFEMDKHARELMCESVHTFEVYCQSDWLYVNGRRVCSHHLRQFPNLRTFIGDPHGYIVPNHLTLKDVLSPSFPSYIKHVHVPIVLWPVTSFQLDLTRLRNSKLRQIDVVVHSDYEILGDEGELPADRQDRDQLDQNGRAQCLMVQAKLAEMGITVTLTEYESNWRDAEIFEME